MTTKIDRLRYIAKHGPISNINVLSVDHDLYSAGLIDVTNDGYTIRVTEAGLKTLNEKEPTMNEQEKSLREISEYIKNKRLNGDIRIELTIGHYTADYLTSFIDKHFPVREKVTVYRFTYSYKDTPYILQYQSRSEAELSHKTRSCDKQYYDVSEITVHEQYVTKNR